MRLDDDLQAVFAVGGGLKSLCDILQAEPVRYHVFDVNIPGSDKLDSLYIIKRGCPVTGFKAYVVPPERVQVDIEGLTGVRHCKKQDGSSPFD